MQIYCARCAITHGINAHHVCYWVGCIRNGNPTRGKLKTIYCCYQSVECCHLNAVPSCIQEDTQILCSHIAFRNRYTTNSLFILMYCPNLNHSPTFKIYAWNFRVCKQPPLKSNICKYRTTYSHTEHF